MIESMTEKIHGWKRVAIGQNVLKFSKTSDISEKTVYVKSNSPSHRGYGDVIAEYNSYKRLRPYLQMPRVRLINKDISNPKLAIQNVVGTPLDKLLKDEKMDEFEEAFREFFRDLVNLWKHTLQPMDETQLAEGGNPRIDCFQLIQTYRTSNEVEPIFHKPLIINGVLHDSLRQRLDQSEKFLTRNKEPWMSYTHGDELLQNIISTPSTTYKYMAIDPRNSAVGYYTPARSADFLIGYTLLFNYQWETPSLQILEDRIEISYSVTEEFTRRDAILRTLFKDVVAKLRQFHPLEVEMLREYLYHNLARSYIDRLMSGNLPKTRPHKIAHLAIAMEIAKDIDNALSNPSYLVGL